MRWDRAVCSLLLLLGLLVQSVRADDEPHGGPEPLKHLKYRLIGPATGGRVSRACGVPGDPLTYYFAGAASGVWKSTDGGLTWKPIFDKQPISSIGCLAVAPSDPNVIYVGSGEANIRGNVAAGDGIYKSTDAGRTWSHVWKQEGQIGQLIIHPTNPDIAYAAVLGHAFGPNPERGVYRTTDGGKNWQRVLQKNPDTGAIDVCFDPSNPRILFATLWQARRKPWEMTSGGPGSGLYRSADGGDSWQQLVHKEDPDPEHWGKGLPEGIWGRAAVAVAAANPQRVYALIEAEKGGLFRSEDGGKSWDRVNEAHYLTQRAWYFCTLTLDPKNADIVWVPQVPLLKSIDGGKTFKRIKGPHHGDHHDLWIDPTNPRRIIDSNDGGVDISTNGGESWYAPPLPIAQFYHVNADNRLPYHVAGNMQDMGTASGPSNSLRSDGITIGDWHGVGGGETGFSVPDPSNPDVVYSGEYGGILTRYDHRTRQATNISIYPANPSGHGAATMRYRFQWTAPILISPHDPKVVYHGGNLLFRTTDHGLTWKAISPDLTRNDKTKQQWSGGPITGDNTTAEYYCTIFALAESPIQKGILWAGSDDGLVHVSTDGGQNWKNVTKNIPGIPEWGTVSCIEASRFQAGTAYIVVDNHRLDDMKPYLYKTTDYGQTWESLSGKLPSDVYLHVVREDPKKQGGLFVGTERGVAYSTDGGAMWQQLKLNLPTVAVHDLVVKGDDLVVGTNGRSIWILDDLTPIRELSETTNKDIHLFTSLPAIRWRYHGPVSSVGDQGVGKNPPEGAILHYFLKQKPKNPITLEILDGSGAVVQTFKSKKKDEDKEEKETPVRAAAEKDQILPPLEEDEDEGSEDDPDRSYSSKKPKLTTDPGVHRLAWDLAMTGPKRIKKAKVDSGNPAVGPMIVPGKYTVRLTVDGKTVTTLLQVIPDPRVSLSEQDLAKQNEFTKSVGQDITRLAGIVERLRSIKEQIQTRDKLIERLPAAQPVLKAGKALVKKLDTLEAEFHNPKAEVVYDILAQKGGAKLYSQLGYVYEWLKDSDALPTQGMKEVAAELHGQLDTLEKDFKSLLAGDLQKLNEQAQKLSLPTILVPETPAAVVLGDPKPGPDSQEQAGVPKGKITEQTLESKVFPDTVRQYWVYVPAQYTPDKPACVMVFQDGASYMNPKGDFRVPIVFDNLIHKKEMPVTIGIFINPGRRKTDKPDARPSNRSFEYDTLSDQYVRFLEEEILPAVGREYNLHKDAAGGARSVESVPVVSVPSLLPGSGPICSARYSATLVASRTSGAATATPE